MQETESNCDRCVRRSVRELNFLFFQFSLDKQCRDNQRYTEAFQKIVQIYRGFKEMPGKQ